MAQLLSKMLQWKASAVQAGALRSDAALKFYHKSFYMCSCIPEISWMWTLCVMDEKVMCSLFSKARHWEQTIYMHHSICTQNNQSTLSLKGLLCCAGLWMKTGLDYLEVPPSPQGQELDLKFGTHWQMIQKCLLVFLQSERCNAQYF